MNLQVNGHLYTLPEQWQDEALLWILRELFGLTGTKFGCGVGICGACTVLVDGAAVRSCQTAPSSVDGRRITTIEGLAGVSGHLGALQQAWLDEAVSQCGYCQAGQIMSAAALLARVPQPSPGQIDEALAGNLCRCGTQQRIRNAVLRAAGATQ
jgi:isoquinoline 1-oxidoreductase alpha subunit